MVDLIRSKPDFSRNNQNFLEFIGSLRNKQFYILESLKWNFYGSQKRSDLVATFTKKNQIN